MGAPLGAAVLVGSLVAPLVAPEWKAAGLPWFFVQAKNVEQMVVAAGLLTAAAIPWLVRLRAGRAVAGVAAAIGASMLAAKGPGFLVSNAPGAILASLLAASLSLTWRDQEDGVATPGDTATEEASAARQPAWVGVLAVLTLASVVGVFSLTAPPIDVYHDGEVLSSALDFLHGGRPFETFLWPHGLHDTGLTALWILITGKVGTSPVVLAYATCCALGVLAAYLLTRALTRSPTASLATALAVSLPVLAGTSSGTLELLSLYRLGVLFFVILGFAVLISSSPRRAELAGICFALAHLYRVEAGLFGATAASLVIAWRSLGTSGAAWSDRIRHLTRDLLRFLAGIALCLGACRAAFGWPGQAWFEYTLQALPKYHRDAAGMTAQWFASSWRSVDAPGALLLAWLTFLALLLVQTVAHLRPTDGPRTRAGASAEPLLFLAAFAVLATRSAIDRSDDEHIRQWVALPLLGVLVLAASAAREMCGLSRRRAVALMFVLVGSVPVLGGFISPAQGPDPLAEVGGAPKWRLFVEHLRPNPPQGACGDRMFTPTESRLHSNRSFIDATCEVERLLASRHVTSLAITHSAPWYWVRFGMPVLSRYFAPVRAYTPLEQGDLVDDLRRGRPQALLRVVGYGALSEFDIPDAFRVPVVDTYLRARRQGVEAIATPLGDLYFWHDPPACAAPSAAPEETVRTQLRVELIASYGFGGMVYAQGWAMDGNGKALRRLILQGDSSLISPRLEYGLSNSKAGQPAEGRGLGWEFTARLPEGRATLREEKPLELLAVHADGRTDRVSLRLRSARPLPPLSGPGWRGLGAALSRSDAQGLADRSEACAAAGGGTECACRETR